MKVFKKASYTDDRFNYHHVCMSILLSSYASFWVYERLINKAAIELIPGLISEVRKFYGKRLNPYD